MTTKKTLITKLRDLLKIPAKTLPSKLSATIRVALDDLEKIERSSRFGVNMGSWFQRNEEQCQVCFAGSVMAKTLGVSLRVLNDKDNPSGEISPLEFKPAIRRKLFALNNVRAYSVALAVKQFYGEHSRSVDKFEGSDFNTYDLTWVGYEEAPILWRQNMNKIADRLERIGL